MSDLPDEMIERARNDYLAYFEEEPSVTEIVKFLLNWLRPPDIDTLARGHGLVLARDVEVDANQKARNDNHACYLQGRIKQRNDMLNWREE